MNSRTIFWAVGVFYLIMCSIAHSYAQSALPTINAVADSGQVTLTWVCQYDGVKSITVKRSTDSNANFATIGFVKDVTKGAQHYTDFVPALGVWYYKLNVVFNSGLSWSSNVCKVLADKPLPHQGISLASAQLHTVNDMTNNIANEAAHNEHLPKLTLRLTYPDIDMNDASFILPKYISTHKVFGHVIIKLPFVNFKQHVYSVRFFSVSGVSVVDILRIDKEEVIIDKLNFGRSGTYKYAIRCDGVLLESGYVKLSM